MAQFYNSNTEILESIPDAPFYVLSNDTFMSGWGPARGKINTCVVPCSNMKEAMAVEKYVCSRTDQKRIRIIENKPRPKSHVLYSLCLGWLKQID